MSAGHRDLVRRSGLTIPYRISRMGGVIHWFIWFGRQGDYQCLPTRTCTRLGSFGLVASVFTTAYHRPDLGRTRPRVAFTNHYLRIEGTGYRLL